MLVDYCDRMCGLRDASHPHRQSMMRTRGEVGYRFSQYVAFSTR